MPTCIHEIPIKGGVLREIVPLEIRSATGELSNVRYNAHNIRKLETEQCKLQIISTGTSRSRGLED